MDFVRIIKDSNDLEKIIEIPKGLKNRKVEVIILPYTEKEDSSKVEKKNVRGALSKYKDQALLSKESDAWSEAVAKKHENS